MKKMQEQLSNIKVDFYKSAKVTVRATAAMTNNPEFVEARKAMLSIAGGIVQLQMSADSIPLSPMDLFAMGKHFTRLRIFYCKRMKTLYQLLWRM